MSETSRPLPEALNSFSIGEVGLSGVSFAVSNAGAKIPDEFSLADVVFEGDVLVRGRHRWPQIPLDLLIG